MVEAGSGGADLHRRATRREDFDREGVHLRPNGVGGQQDAVDAAAARDARDLGAGILLRGEDEVGGAERERETSRFGLEDVDPDDVARTAEHCAEDRRRADAAHADHRDGVAGLGARDVEDRTDARRHAARDQGRGERVEILGDDRAVHRRAHRVRAEAAQAEGRRDVGAVGAVHAERVVGEGAVGVCVGRAEGLLAPEAVVALAARPDEQVDDLVADLDAVDPRAHRLDDPRTLVTAHRGDRAREVAVEHVEVGAAEAGGRHPDQDLARSRLVELDRLDREGLPELTHDRCCCLHGRNSKLGECHSTRTHA